MQVRDNNYNDLKEDFGNKKKSPILSKEDFKKEIQRQKAALGELLKNSGGGKEKTDKPEKIPKELSLTGDEKILQSDSDFLNPKNPEFFWNKNKITKLNPKEISRPERFLPGEWLAVRGKEDIMPKVFVEGGRENTANGVQINFPKKTGEKTTPFFSTKINNIFYFVVDYCYNEKYNRIQKHEKGLKMDGLVLDEICYDLCDYPLILLCHRKTQDGRGQTVYIDPFNKAAILKKTDKLIKK